MPLVTILCTVDIIAPIMPIAIMKAITITQIIAGIMVTAIMTT
jgi:hypothetical protein